ncbi:ExbD/TolR family protein [Roseivirga misakiensis]|uniref:Biopolymer transporter ExbD n=1 Tax=Roseivirga misakiensis TaxID=1563681 RepID=A0A1E5SK93_9BACT|nr:biopolymer transporter ExbD [Roseivirga misakiensis]OEJ99540.1 hypothetical protein BFP71_08145 [Roseivirga misakiensis]
MINRKNRPAQEVNAGSMADIAFLLLIFFLVTTQIATNKGITMVLPPKLDKIDNVPLNERNVLKIQINSSDQLLVENDPLDDIDEISEIVYDFVLNFGNPDIKKKGKSKISDQELFASLPVDMKNYIRRNLSLKTSSDGPSEAVVSLKTDRGSGYDVYIKVMDEISAAYYKIYGQRVGLTSEEYRKLNRNDPRQKLLYDKGKLGIGRAISLAEPTTNGG